MFDLTRPGARRRFTLAVIRLHHVLYRLSGGRLLGLAAVPLQEVDAAIAELRHAVQTLGLVGVELGSNINGVPVGAPQFDPFFEACEALDAAVFVHAIRPAGMERLVGPPPLQQVPPQVLTTHPKLILPAHENCTAM